MKRMKRYESLSIAAFITTLLLAMSGSFWVEGTPTSGVRGQAPSLYKTPDCREMAGHFYVKNKCGGILTISSKNEFILQKSGLYSGHPLAEMVKETCASSHASWRSSGPAHFVRYRHASSNKYICFNKNGKVKAVSGRRVDRRGRLCMFEEVAVDQSYHSLQSSHNPSWILGFNNNNLEKVYQENRLTDHWAAKARRGWVSRRENCDAQFSSAANTPANLADKFSGLINLISDLENNVRVEDKAANLDQDLRTFQSSGGGQQPTVSKAHLEALKLQHELVLKGVRNKIRHFPKKQRLRPSRKDKKRYRKSLAMRQTQSSGQTN